MRRTIKKGVLFLLVFFSLQPMAYAVLKPAADVLILFGNEWTAFTRGYPGPYQNQEEYSGYFAADKYYAYQKNTGFVPVGYAAGHYTPPGGDYWSGNFLNWATMANVDLVRKTFTGGKRSKDTNKSTRLVRASIDPGQGWQLTYDGADLDRLVPAAYAEPGNLFASNGQSLTVINSSGRPVSGEHELQVEVCVDSMPEANCVDYGGHFKPEGFLQLWGDTLHFGLMSYSASQPSEGGVLRVPIGSIAGEYSQKSGRLSHRSGMIQFINDSGRKGWGPVAELYYEALRYLKGNAAGQAAYCGEGFIREDKFPVYGCDWRKPWDDPGTDPMSIIIVSDEYPSRDDNALPGSFFNPTYVDTPMAFGVNAPYNPDVTTLTNLIGDAEGVTGTRQVSATVHGDCGLQVIGGLGTLTGVCPGEPLGGGTFYTAGLAYEGFTGDLRPRQIGWQNVETWVLAYRGTTSSVYQPPSLPMSPLMLAAKYGRFADANGNHLPDMQNEWDADGDGVPDNFIYADDGNKLLSAYGRILMP